MPFVDLLRPAGPVELDHLDVEGIVEIGDRRIVEREMPVLSDAETTQVQRMGPQELCIAPAFDVGIAQALDVVRRLWVGALDNPFADPALEAGRMVGTHPDVLVHVKDHGLGPGHVRGVVQQCGNEGQLRVARGEHRVHDPPGGYRRPHHLGGLIGRALRHVGPVTMRDHGRPVHRPGTGLLHDGQHARPDAAQTGSVRDVAIPGPAHLEGAWKAVRKFLPPTPVVEVPQLGVSAKKGFLVTFKIEEGQQYRVASVNFASSIATLDGNTLASFSQVYVGSLYNAEALEKSVENMQIEASRRGYSFAVVKPRGDRNFEAHTVSITFAIDEGPRVYIERINIHGNTRTRDYVIRREFDISEGDAYNRALVDRSERRLKNLDFFKSVKITTEPGSSSDRVVLNVELEEKSTGDFSVSGGYSTTDGALAEVSISERNLLGRGLYAKASVTYGQYARGVTLSFVEPYLLDYRVAAGIDVFYREQLPNSYISYGTRTVGFSPRLGFGLREDLSLQLRYSLYQQQITLPAQLDNCNNILGPPRFNPTPVLYQPGAGRHRSHRQYGRTASIRAVWATANPHCRFARNWPMARPSRRR